jgi:MATE family multidrug resistance protein
VILITYQLAAGQEFVACATIGYFVGAGKLQAAEDYAKSVVWVTVVLVLVSTSLLAIFRVELVAALTPMKDVQQTTLAIIWIICIQMVPDCTKGTLRGVIKARGLQFKAMLINLSGHWCVNLTLIWLLAFKLKMGLSGIWLAKLVLETYIFVAYCLLVWGTAVEEAVVETSKQGDRKESTEAVR